MKYLKYVSNRFITFAVTIFLSALFMYFVPLIKGDVNFSFSFEGLIDHFKSIFTFEFGYSRYYRTDASILVLRYIPYTMMLCLVSAMLAWIFGNMLGLIAGTRKNAFTGALEAVSMIIYPIPYYILALLVQVIFAYKLELFPIIAQVITCDGTWAFIRTLIQGSVLPALTIILAGMGWWVISTRAAAQSVMSEDFIHFARCMNIKRSTIDGYVRRNCLAGQCAGFSTQLSAVFSGALITEMIYSYPGVGFLIKIAVMNNEYNLLFACTLISMMTVTAVTFVIDILLPLIDPRIKL